MNKMNTLKINVLYGLFNQTKELLTEIKTLMESYGFQNHAPETPSNAYVVRKKINQCNHKFNFKDLKKLCPSSVSDSTIRQTLYAERAKGKLLLSARGPNAYYIKINKGAENEKKI